MSRPDARVLPLREAPRDSVADLLAADVGDLGDAGLSGIASCLALFALRAGAIPRDVGGRRPTRATSIRRALRMLEAAAAAVRAMGADL